MGDVKQLFFSQILLHVNVRITTVLKIWYYELQGTLGLPELK